MRTDRLVCLSHTGSASREGRACVAYLHGGGILTKDWVALVHSDGWGVPATFEAELIDLAKSSCDTGIHVACRLERRSDFNAPGPPFFDVVGDNDGGLRRLDNIPSGTDLIAVERLRRLNELMRIFCSASDPHFRRKAVTLLRLLDYGPLPHLRTPIQGATLGEPGSWVHVVRRHAEEVLASDAPATVQSAELYWLLQAIPAYTIEGTEMPVPIEDGTTDTT